MRRDHAVAGHPLQLLAQRLPKVAPEDDDGEVAHLAGLDERERLEQFVGGAEAAREHDEPGGVLRQHVLAGEEVAEVDANVEVGVRRLFERQLNRATDARGVGVAGAAVGTFHHAGAAAGDDGEA